MSPNESQRENEFGQPIGLDVPDWKPVAAPDHSALEGRFCRVEALDVARHSEELFSAFSQGETGGLWTYIPVGPFDTLEALQRWMETACASQDPLFYALIERETGQAIGIASYLRITPDFGVIEVGNIVFSPRLQKTPIATEVMFLMMQHAFNTLGYRRYEWKCDALNAPSRRAAARFGFAYDGLFRQALVYKGRNRDTAWFSILDKDWPAIERGFQSWLDPENFDEKGTQKRALSDLMKAEQTAGS